MSETVTRTVLVRGQAKKVTLRTVTPEELKAKKQAARAAAKRAAQPMEPTEAEASDEE